MEYFRFIVAEANKSVPKFQLPIVKEGGRGQEEQYPPLLIFFIVSPSEFLLSRRMFIFPYFEYIRNAFNFHIVN